MTFIAMKLLGQGFNLMTLGGLAAAVGLVIDDKIVVVENIVLHRDSGEGPLEATASALKELTVPLIGSTLTPIVVFLPLITITGVTGTFFSALAIAMSVALLTSLVLALVWTSNLSTRLVRRHQHGVHEAEPSTGVFAPHHRVLRASMRRSLTIPFALGALCLVLVAASYLSYRALGSDLLPAFDEGGFVLDYVMPPGSSLQETNRVLRTSTRFCARRRRWRARRGGPGLELGLAAVTEPNTGDFAVKLKSKRSRSVEDIISEVRGKVATSQPGLDVEFIQVLQDMIGDLTGAPEPVVVKLFSQDPDLLSDVGAAGGRGAGQSEDRRQDADRRRRRRHREDDERSGGRFNVNSQAADRAGFTTEELGTVGVAMVEGEPATAPVLVNDRPYPVRVRYPASARGSLEAMSNTMLVSSNGIDGNARVGGDDRRAARADGNHSREPAASRRSDRAARRRGHGYRHCRRAKSGGGPQAAAVDSRRVRRHLQGAAEVVPRFDHGARIGHRA